MTTIRVTHISDSDEVWSFIAAAGEDRNGADNLWIDPVGWDKNGNVVVDVVISDNDLVSWTEHQLDLLNSVISYQVL